jgi:hypothetical protein
VVTSLSLSLSGLSLSSPYLNRLIVAKLTQLAPHRLA